MWMCRCRSIRSPGKPFRYEVKDGVAHIRGTPPKGDEQIPVYNLHYEIAIRKWHGGRSLRERQATFLKVPLCARRKEKN